MVKQRTMSEEILRGTGEKEMLIMNEIIGIALIPHDGKMCERILETRTKDIVENRLDKRQYGFKQKISIADDLVFPLKTVCEMNYKFNKRAYLASFIWRRLSTVFRAEYSGKEGI
ncbi:UNVERIFIED_CONTAM: hypothetical protein RMT77_002936 [Armadillidium vulgare]